MFSIKILNLKSTPQIKVLNTVDTIFEYIKRKLNFENSKTISDNNSVELSSGSELQPKNDEIVVELLIRKHIIIKENDFLDNSELDRHLSRIKHFCDSAKNIEDFKYLPINMRDNAN